MITAAGASRPDSSRRPLPTYATAVNRSCRIAPTFASTSASTRVARPGGAGTERLAALRVPLHPHHLLDAGVLGESAGLDRPQRVAQRETLRTFSQNPFRA